MPEKSTNLDQKTPDLKILQAYFADFKEFVKSDAKTKDKKFETALEAFLGENNLKVISDLDGSIIPVSTITGRKLYTLLDKAIGDKGQKNKQFSLQEILTLQAEKILDLAAVNMVDFNKKEEVFKDKEVCVYLIEQFQEFVRVKEAEKQNEQHFSPVTVALNVVANSEISQTNSQYNPTNMPKIGLVGVNLGRDNLKQFKPSPEAIALQVEIDNLSQSGFEWYDKNNKTRDDNYLVQKEAEKEKLEADRLEAQKIEAEKIAKEKARLEEIAQLRKRLAELQGESPEQSPPNKLPETIPAQETKPKIDFEKTYTELFAKFESMLGELSGEFIMFVQFVVDSFNQNPKSEFETNNFAKWQEINGSLNVNSFSKIIQILHKNRFRVYGKSDIRNSFNSQFCLFDWVKNAINNPESLQLPAEETTQTTNQAENPKNLPKEEISAKLKELELNEILVFDDNIYKALGEIVAAKLGMKLTNNVLVELMNLQYSVSNKGQVNTEFIKLWRDSLGINQEHANKIISYLYPIITNRKDIKKIMEDKNTFPQPYKEMFRQIRDYLSKMNEDFRSVYLVGDNETNRTFNHYKNQDISVNKLGTTTDGKSIKNFAHPMIERIKKS